MRYARICPNTNGWTQASGGYKGPRTSFPGKNGFGFDEWLLGSPKIEAGHLEGLRAGFIQGYKKQQANFQDDVTLYYLDTQMNGVSAIQINKCRRLTDQEALDIFNEYSQRGFLTKMFNDVTTLNINMSPHPQLRIPSDMFNVVFHPDDATLLNPQPSCRINYSRYGNLYK